MNESEIFDKFNQIDSKLEEIAMIKKEMFLSKNYYDLTYIKKLEITLSEAKKLRKTINQYLLNRMNSTP